MRVFRGEIGLETVEMYLPPIISGMEEKMVNIDIMLRYLPLLKVINDQLEGLDHNVQVDWDSSSKFDDSVWYNFSIVLGGGWYIPGGWFQYIQRTWEILDDGNEIFMESHGELITGQNAIAARLRVEIEETLKGWEQQKA